MESCAILQYLAEKHPTPMLPEGEARWDILPWVYWQAANVGPNFGNKLSYTRYMDDVPTAQKQHPLERFNKEALRLMAVLAKQLGSNPWICGTTFSIADIAVYPWVRGWKWSKVDITKYPSVLEWVNGSAHDPGSSAAYPMACQKTKSTNGAKPGKRNIAVAAPVSLIMRN